MSAEAIMEKVRFKEPGFYAVDITESDIDQGTLRIDHGPFERLSDAVKEAQRLEMNAIINVEKDGCTFGWCFISQLDPADFGEAKPS